VGNILQIRHPTASKGSLLKIGSGSWIGPAGHGATRGDERKSPRVAADAVVAHDVPDHTPVAGTPAIPRRNLLYRPGVTRAWSD